MADIRVTKTGDDEYSVEVREADSTTRHRVTATPAAVDRYAPGAEGEMLVRESFRFLLEREPKEAILSSFEISVIERYFPEYADEIGRRLPAS